MKNKFKKIINLILVVNLFLSPCITGFADEVKISKNTEEIHYQDIDKSKNENDTIYKTDNADKINKVENINDTSSIEAVENTESINNVEKEEIIHKKENLANLDNKSEIKSEDKEENFYEVNKDSEMPPVEKKFVEVRSLSPLSFLSNNSIDIPGIPRFGECVCANNVDITKIWDEGTGEKIYHNDITVNLLKNYTVTIRWEENSIYYGKVIQRKDIKVNGILYKSAKFGKTENWKYSFDNIPDESYMKEYYNSYPENIKEDFRKAGIEELPYNYWIDSVKDFSYSITEENVEGYTSKITQDCNKYLITNTRDKKVEIPEISGNHGSELPKLVPSVKINKQIDYLGDGIRNPDTRIQQDTSYKNQLKDFYRLYLDIEGEKLKRDYGTDLLVVIDTSASMINNSDMKIPGNRNYVTRRDAVDYLVNDTGLIQHFLDINSKNRVGIISFDGRNATVNEPPEYSYRNDITVLQNWSNKFNRVQIRAYKGTGTNYDAGLLEAEHMFANSTNRKAMIFISDGVPSYYVRDYDGGRGGTGTDEDYMLELCKYETEEFVKTFYQRNPDILTYTVGISEDINSEGLNSSPVILREMASLGHGKYIGINEDMSILIDKLKASYESSISRVKITDTLSEYVDFLSENPDIKVTRKDIKNGVETVLWNENGQTNSNQNGKYIKNIRYDRAKKELVMVFNPELELIDDIVYTVSFNIRTTKKAVDEYLSEGYKNTGDKNTDYGENDTSSDKEGFRANTKAVADYSWGNKNNLKEETELYPYPVVQVITGTELPSTGGAGIKVIKIAGTLLITAAMYSLLRNKKNE